MSKRARWTTFAMAVLLTACSSPRDANKKNFLEVAKVALKDECLSIPYLRPPVPKWGWAEHKKQVAALAAAGILVPEANDTYDLSEKGKSIPVVQERGLQMMHPMFCVAHLKPVEITNFTVPGPNPMAMGMTASEVHVRIEPIDVQEWAKRPDVQEAYPEIKKALSAGIERNIGMILTDNGWVDQKHFK